MVFITKVPAPIVFISYAWEDKTHVEWVKSLATRLRKSAGVDVKLDRWMAGPGDDLPLFMEAGVRDSRFVLMICSPAYKASFDSRTRGVGYEARVITAELFLGGETHKFIAVHRKGEWKDAAPSIFGGIYYIDFRGDLYEKNFDVLVDSLWGRRELPVPLGGPPPLSPTASTSGPALDPKAWYSGLIRLRCGRFQRTFGGSRMNDLSDGTYMQQTLSERVQERIVTAKGISFREQEFEHMIRSALELHNKVFVLGRAGRGKTSLLYWTALTQLSLLEEGKSNLVPIYVRLADMALAGSFRAYIESDLRESGHDGIFPWLSALIDRGDVLVLLDALDEVSTQALPAFVGPRGAIAEMLRFVRGPQARFVLSCRESLYSDFHESLRELKRPGEPEGFIRLELKPFSRDKIIAYTQSYFSNSKRADSFLATVLGEHSMQAPLGRYKQVLQEPLYLHMLCWLYDNTIDADSRLPNAEDELWEETLRRLLAQRDIKAVIASSEMRLAEELGFHKLICGRRLLQTFVEAVAIELAREEGHDSYRETALQWLGRLHQWEILIAAKWDPPEYEFSIPTLDEYFAAKHLAARYRDGDPSYARWFTGRSSWRNHDCPNPACGTALKPFASWIRRPENEEIVLLFVGSLKNAEAEVALVRSIRKKWIRFIFDKYLRFFFEAFRYGMSRGPVEMDGPAIMGRWTGIDLKLKCLSRCRHAQPILGIEVAKEVLSHRGGLSIWEDLYAGGHEAIAYARVRSNRQELVDFYCHCLEIGISAPAAAEALGLLGAEDASDTLIAAFRKSNHLAGKALGRTGGPNALPILIAGLDHRHRWMIESAIRGLEELRDERAVPHLLPLLEHRDHQLRWRTADALGRIGSPAAEPALIKLLTSRDPSVRWAAVEALRRLDPADTYRAIGTTREEEDGPIPIATIPDTGDPRTQKKGRGSVEFREPSSPSTSLAPTRCEEHRRSHWILIQHIFRIFRIIEIISRPLVGVFVLFIFVPIFLLEFLFTVVERWGWVVNMRARRILRDLRRQRVVGDQ